MSEPLTYPPCKVCGGVATGLHYGVNTCEACKAFFRRAVCERDKYHCQKEGKCEITDRRRGNCSSCRIQKCIDLGMSKDAVRHGRYTIETRTKTILEVKRLEGKKSGIDRKELKTTKHSSSDDEDLSVAQRKRRRLAGKGSKSGNVDEEFPGSSRTSSSSSDESSELSPEEMDNLTKILVAVQDDIYPNLVQYFDKQLREEMQRKFYEKYQAKKEYFKLKPLSSTEYDEMYKATGIDVDDRIKLINRLCSHSERGIVKYIAYARAIPGFNALDDEDKMQLIINSRFEYWLLGHYLHFNPELKVNVGFEIQHHVDDTTRYYGNPETVEGIFQFTRVMIKFNVSYEEIALLRAIVILFRDRCPLKEPEKVEALQWKLILCLKHLISKLHPGENSRFSQYMDRLITMRTLNDQNKKSNEMLIEFQNNIVKLYPLYYEFLNRVIAT